MFLMKKASFYQCHKSFAHGENNNIRKSKDPMCKEFRRWQNMHIFRLMVTIDNQKIMFRVLQKS